MQGESPRVMGRAGDSDPLIRDNVYFLARDKVVQWIGAKVNFIVSLRNRESLGQFSGSGTKPAFVVNSAAPFHGGDSAGRLNRTK